MATTKLNAAQIVGNVGAPAASEVVKLGATADISSGLRSVTSSADLAARGNVSADGYFYGDGSKLINVSSDSVDVTNTTSGVYNIVSVLDAGNGVTLRSRDDGFAFIDLSNGNIFSAGSLHVTGGLHCTGAVSGVTTLDGTGDLTMGTITMSGFAVDADGDTNLKSLAVDDNSTVGCDSDTDLLTLGAQTVLVAADSSLMFRDAALKINSSGDGFLDITADTQINITGAMKCNSTFLAGSGTFSGLSANGAIANASSIDGTGDLTMPTITMTGFAVDADGDTNLKSLAVDDNSTVGCDSDTDLLTLGAQSVLVAADASLLFRDAGLKINSSANGYLDITADTQINITGAMKCNSTFLAGSGTFSGLSANGAIANASSIDGTGDLTMPTITMTGFAVDADGDTNLKSLAVDDNSTVGCDSDTDLLTLGAQSVLVAADASLLFRDAGLKINSSANGYLDITADTQINLTGAVKCNSTFLAGSGTFSGLSANGAIANASNIDGSGDLTMGTITMTGFSVDADGDTNLKTLAVDDNSTVGCDSDADLLTLGSAAVTLASDAKFYLRDASQYISSDADNYIDISAGTQVNVSGALNVTGEVQLGASEVPVAVGADSFYIRDATDGKVHRDTVADVATGMAGRGLQASSSAGTFSLKGFRTETYITASTIGPSSAPSCSLSGTPLDKENVLVYLNGQFQSSGSSKTGTDVRDYSLSGSVVGFNSTLDADDVIKIVYLSQ